VNEEAIAVLARLAGLERALHSFAGDVEVAAAVAERLRRHLETMADGFPAPGDVPPPTAEGPP
jgi:hypothetical protein